MDEKPIYGAQRIADYLGKSLSTLHRWRARPEGAFLEVGSMSNVGGGFGQALWSYPSSLDNLKRLVETHVRDIRRRVALKRWGKTNVSSASSVLPHEEIFTTVESGD